MQDLDLYLAAGGYSGLRYAFMLGRPALVAAVDAAGLSDRSGAGLPVAVTWQACSAAETLEKFVVCNAVDADPRARTAAAVLAGDPHAVLEGLLVAAYAVGATRGFVCVSDASEGQMVVVQQVLEQIERRGLLGEEILGSGFTCEVTVTALPVSLVADEETALIRLLEGRQAIPYLCPPDPATRGLHGRPTVVHTAETLANVAMILRAGGTSAGSDVAPPDPGTKIVTVWWRDEGRVIEVPLGASLRTVVRDVTGVDPDCAEIKGVRYGGATGRFYAGSGLDTPIGGEDTGGAAPVGGPGVLEVIPAGGCGVELARDTMSYLSEQSCGACVACREGTRQLADMLDDISALRGSPDLELMAELAGALEDGSICGLGLGAAAAFLSSLEAFGADFAAHIDEKRCPGSRSRV